jgi:hypothetical protein
VLYLHALCGAGFRLLARPPHLTYVPCGALTCRMCTRSATSPENGRAQAGRDSWAQWMTFVVWLRLAASPHHRACPVDSCRFTPTAWLNAGRLWLSPQPVGCFRRPQYVLHATPVWRGTSSIPRRPILNESAHGNRRPTMTKPLAPRHRPRQTSGSRRLPCPRRPGQPRHVSSSSVILCPPQRTHRSRIPANSRSARPVQPHRGLRHMISEVEDSTGATS